MPRTSRGFELRAVLLGGCLLALAVLGGERGGGCWGKKGGGGGGRGGGGGGGGWGKGGGKGGKRGAPGLRDDDVVEGSVAFAEAGEADFEDHCSFEGEGGRWMMVKGCALRSCLVGLKLFLSRA